MILFLSLLNILSENSSTFLYFIILRWLQYYLICIAWILVNNLWLFTDLNIQFIFQRYLLFNYFWTLIWFYIELNITTSSCSLAYWCNCMNTVGFCKFSLGIFNIWSNEFLSLFFLLLCLIFLCLEYNMLSLVYLFLIVSCLHTLRIIIIENQIVLIFLIILDF